MYFRVPTLVLTLLLVSSLQAAEPLSIAVNASSVRVSNTTDAIVLFYCARHVEHGVVMNDSKAFTLSDDDRDGTITFPITVPFRSVWVAVDLKTGAVATGAPDGFPLRVHEHGEALLRKDAEGGIALIAKAIPRMALLTVRPGVGAWLQRGLEGGRGDDDSKPDGTLSLAFENAKQVGMVKERAPKHLKAGDIVIVVDLGHYSVTRGEVSK
jgi:hypothetical protein